MFYVSHQNHCCSRALVHWQRHACILMHFLKPIAPCLGSQNLTTGLNSMKGPENEINIRILHSTFSGIPLMSGPRIGMQDAFDHAVFGAANIGWTVWTSLRLQCKSIINHVGVPASSTQACARLFSDPWKKVYTFRAYW